MRKRGKRGISTIIVTIILIGLSLSAIVIVWNVISNMLKSGTQQVSVQFGTMFLSLKIEKVTVDSTTGNVSVTVSRGSGQGDMTGIAFVISDGKNTKVIKKTATMNILDTQTFTFTSSDLGSVLFVKEVDIAPIVNEQVGGKVDNYTTNYGTASTPALSCLDLRKKVGDGIYWIDTDGIETGNSAFQVYCDMTTDEGGWTLAAVCRPEDNPNYPTYNANVPASKCWSPSKVGSVLDPNSATTTKLADSDIIAILTKGENTTRGHWTQKYRYDNYDPADLYIYNKITNPSQWSSNGGGISGKNFYSKFNYADSWGSSPLLTYSSGCASPSNGWSNQYGESCGYYGAWNAGCENAPSSSHCCACVTYDERANIILYIR